MIRHTYMAMILSLASLAACSGSQNGSALGPLDPNAKTADSGKQQDSATAPAPEQAADKPVIVAGAYLTCSPLKNAKAPDSEVDVGCRVDGTPKFMSYYDLKKVQWNMKIVGLLHPGLTAQLYPHPTNQLNFDGIYVFHTTASGQTARGLLATSPAGFEAQSADGKMRVVGVNPGETQPSTANRALTVGYQRLGTVDVPSLIGAVAVPAAIDNNFSLTSGTSGAAGGSGGAGGGSGGFIGTAGGGTGFSQGGGASDPSAVGGGQPFYQADAGAFGGTPVGPTVDVQSAPAGGVDVSGASASDVSSADLGTSAAGTADVGSVASDISGSAAGDVGASASDVSASGASDVSASGASDVAASGASDSAASGASDVAAGGASDAASSGASDVAASGDTSGASAGSDVASAAGSTDGMPNSGGGDLGGSFAGDPGVQGPSGGDPTGGLADAGGGASGDSSGGLGGGDSSGGAVADAGGSSGGDSSGGAAADAGGGADAGASATALNLTAVATKRLLARTVFGNRCTVSALRSGQCAALIKKSRATLIKLGKLGVAKSTAPATKPATTTTTTTPAKSSGTVWNTIFSFAKPY